MKTKSKGLAIAAVAAVLFTSSAHAFTTGDVAQAAAGQVKCYGVNACKGLGSCGTPNYNNCKGMNACRGMSWLWWDAQSCTQSGGTIMN